MFWIKQMFGLSMISWIFKKVIDSKIKSFNETLEKIKKPKEKRLLVIDDDYAMKSFIEKLMNVSYKVDQLYRIPDDLSVLSGYDAVVVDGLGISNRMFREGFNLLMAYEKPEGQSVVYYSGLGTYGQDRDALYERGVAVVTKGRDPENLAIAIRSAIKKGESNV